MKKSVVIIKKNKEIVAMDEKEKRRRKRKKEIVARFSHIFARRCGKPIFTYLFLVHPGIIILIKKMLNIFSFIKHNMD